MAEKKLAYESRKALYEQAIHAIEEDSMIIQYAYKIKNFTKAAEIFEGLGDYRDSCVKALWCRKQIEKLESEKQEYAYKQAHRRFEEARTAGEYDRAAALFAEIAGYKDADQRAAESNRRSSILVRKSRILIISVVLSIVLLVVLIIAFFKSELWQRAKAAIMEEPYIDRSLPLQEQEIAYITIAAEGETVEYAGLNWIILSKTDDSALLMLKDPSETEELSGIAFRNEGGNAVWSESSLRSWLNTGFLEQYFSEEEKRFLTIHSSGPLYNTVYQTDGGEETEDMVNILSISEALLYEKHLHDLKSNIWLSCPGHSMDTAAYLTVHGEVLYYGYPTDNKEFGVCPVIEVMYH